jgi:hypothetical protein
LVTNGVLILDGEHVPLARLGVCAEIKFSRIIINHFMIPWGEGNFMLNGLKSNFGHVQAWARSCASKHLQKQKQTDLFQF